MPAQLDPGNAAVINLSGVEKFSPDSQTPDGPEAGKESEWNFPDFDDNYNYYKGVPELRSPLHAFGTWVLGKGWTANPADTVTLNHIRGWGQDTFNTIMWGMLVGKKAFGDSFAQVMRDKKTKIIINMKLLTTGRMRIITNPAGRIIRYDYMDVAKKKVLTKLKPKEILHFCNERIGDEIHGNSVIPALKEIIDSMNEAQRDYRRISHLSTIRILYADEQDPTELAKLETQYKVAVEKGFVMILPGSEKDYNFKDLTAPPVEAFTAWMRYLESKFYKAIGFPKIGLGDAEGIPESGGIMSYVTYEPQFQKAITDLKDSLWNQQQLKVEFEGPATLSPSVSNTQDKNIDQTQPAQPSDTQVQGAPPSQ